MSETLRGKKCFAWWARKVFTGKQTPRSRLRTLNHPLVQQEGRKEKWKAGHWVSVNLWERRRQRSENLFLKKIRLQKKSLSLRDILSETDFLFAGSGLCGRVRTRTVGAEMKRLKCYVKMPLKKNSAFSLWDSHQGLHIVAVNKWIRTFLT